MRTVWASARAIPRSSAVSSTLNGSSSRDRASQAVPASSSGAEMPPVHVASGGSPARKPMLATTSPSRTMTPASASKASAARSTPAVSALLDILVRAERGEVLGQLLRSPGVRERIHRHPSARTTSVWLWKPLIPRVRAISPNV